MMCKPDDIVARAVGDTSLVVGAPGSGKTTLLVNRLVSLAATGVPVDALLTLTPTRAQASILRDRLGLSLNRTTEGPKARSLAAFAFAVVSAAHHEQGLVPPDLLSASQVDADIEALLLGHMADNQGPRWPEPLTETVRGLRVFRAELREWMARVTENGLSHERIVEAATTLHRPEWIAASEFAAEYRRVVASARPGAFDSAEIIRRALVVLEDGLPQKFAGLAHVAVDDAMNLTAAGWELLGRLRELGVGLTVVAEPDVAGNTFRGSEPDGVSFYASRWGVAVDVLSEVFRVGPVLREALTKVTERVGTAGMGAQRKAPGVSQDSGIIHTLLTPSPQRESLDIARYLHEAHLQDSVPLDHMLVIARRGSRVSQLVRELNSHGIPARVNLSGVTLRDQPAARDLLDVVALGLGVIPLTPPAAIAALTGLYGGMSLHELRRLRFALRLQADPGEPYRPVDHVLAEALSTRGGFSFLDSAVSAKAQKLAEILDDVRQAGPHTPINQLLWGVWSSSGVGAQWHRRSQENSERSGVWHRALDVVVALFHQATEFSEAHPMSSAELFLDAALTADVPDDVVLPTPLWPAVTVSTPSAVTGLEAHLVVIAGVDDGVWPDMRLRGSLLGAQELIRAARGGALDVVDERKVVRDDELRLFAQSLARATHRVLICASDSEDAQPSPLFDLLDHPDRRLVSRAEPPLSPRSVVGKLRSELSRELSKTNPQEAKTRVLAEDLATLAQWGVAGAHPKDWWGLVDLSTTEPLYADRDIPVSPSSVELLEESPVEWFLSQVARNQSTPEMGLGSLIHQALEKNPVGDSDSLWSVVEESFGQLEFEAGWVEEYHKRIARGMVDALSDYVRDRDSQGFQVIASEKRFHMQFGDAHLTGIIDRIEQGPDGALVVVDLKTGRHKTDGEVVANPQMLAYQMALEHDNFSLVGNLPEASQAGAVLLFVKSGVRGKRYRLAAQEPITQGGREAFLARIQQAASLINQAEFSGGPRVFGGSNSSRHRWHFVGQVCGDV